MAQVGGSAQQSGTAATRESGTPASAAGQARQRGWEAPAWPFRQEGELLWSPSAEQVESANITAFTRYLSERHGRDFDSYDSLWSWSVSEVESFWESVWHYFGVQSSQPYTAVLESRAMPGTRWFPGARLNIAEQMLRHEGLDQPALMYLSETAPLATLSWSELPPRVRLVATRLRQLGVRPGDRVVAFLPNSHEALTALLAVASIGAVWASCSPDFGSRGALDRFGQLDPAVLLCADGYRYGGVDYDRRPEVREIVAGLPSLRQVICVPRLYPDSPQPVAGALDWRELLAGDPVPREGFEFEQVPFDHPLWVLFSSGTTGLPKPIVHGHGGILLEHLKLQTFHMDLRRGDRSFFFTTTGWMMWNFLACALLLAVTPVLYDGNPAYPETDVLWRMAEDAEVRLFGASPTYVSLMARAGIVPKERFELRQLRHIMLAGSPVSPATTAWFYDNVKADLWVGAGSGGTDCCTGFVGAVPTLPVYAGEIQARSLGVAAYAFDPEGRRLVEEVGELVITEPMPSMPVFFWNDTDGSRYRATYFEDYPGLWRQGDFFKVNGRGGCFVLGRSDATLNRHGVRIGTAEIYRALDGIEEIEDGIVVNLDLPGGGFFMPLFVKLAPGAALDAELTDRIRARLRSDYTPRHVPDRILAVPAIPLTRTGKKLEVPLRKLLLGAPLDAVSNPAAMADPDAFAAFADYAATQHDYRLEGPATP